MLFYSQVQSLSCERHGKKNTFDFWNVSKSFMITFAHVTPTLRCKTENIHIYSTKGKEIRPLGCKYRSAHAKRSYLCHSRSELTCLFQCQEKKKGGETHAPFQFFGVCTLLFAPPPPPLHLIRAPQRGPNILWRACCRWNCFGVRFRLTSHATLAERLPAQTNLPERMTDWSVSPRHCCWTKTQVCLLSSELLVFLVIQQKVPPSCCSWQDYW